MNVADFCAKHDACDEVREWARHTGCKTMAELWARDDLPPDYRVWIAVHALSDTDCRLFAVWCARRVDYLLADPRSLTALIVAECYAEGCATDAQLLAAWEAAWEAAGEAAWASAWASAWAAAWAAAWVASREASREAAGAAARAASLAESREAARDSANDAARDAARAAARDASEAAQAQHLIDTHSDLFANQYPNNYH